ncbi:MAG: hypothetical protein HYZ45_12885 [Burkholderiales bacterium]|nr:hypothetical protein [Burkholderiales bacterium]
MSSNTDYYKEVVALLLQHDFRMIKVGMGSYQIWGKGSLRVTVPLPCDSKLYANAIMKTCKINHKF